MEDPIFSARDKKNQDDDGEAKNWDEKSHFQKKMENLQKDLSSKEKINDQKLTDILADKSQRKKFAIGVFRIFDGFLVFCAVGFIIYKVATMDEKSKEQKLDTVKSFFGIGDEQSLKQREQQRKADEEAQQNLYKQLDLLKKMNEEYRESLENSSESGSVKKN